MTQTFTKPLKLTAKETKKEQQEDFFDVAEPSKTTIQNILNYSKNLEVKSSQLVKDVEYVKS